jgi:hypothetical protein
LPLSFSVWQERKKRRSAVPFGVALLVGVVGKGEVEDEEEDRQCPDGVVADGLD